MLKCQLQKDLKEYQQVMQGGSLRDHKMESLMLYGECGNTIFNKIQTF